MTNLISEMQKKSLLDCNLAKDNMYKIEPVHIKNYEFIASTRARKEALDVLIAGVESVLPRTIFKNITYKDGFLKIFKHRHQLSGKKIYVIGAGKACGRMAYEIERILSPKRIAGGIVNSVEKVPTKRIQVRACSFPLPNNYSLNGVKKMLRLTKDVGRNDVVLCLISGGGSALMPYPADGISLEEKRNVIEMMLKRGVRSFEFHHLRKHISKVKGGQLAKLLQPSRVIGIILSDVLDPRDDAPAAGPTYPDKSTYRNAFEVLKKYQMYKDVPKSVRDRVDSGVRGQIEETPKPGEKYFNNVYNYVLGDYKVALKAMFLKAKKLGYTTEILADPIIGEVKDISEDMVAVLKDRIKKNQKPYALIYCTESVVNMRKGGKGGRNQQMAGYLIKELAKIPNMVYAAIDTDGRDYIKGVGGAIIDSDTLNKAMKKKTNIDYFLNTYNTYELHRRLSSHILMENTGTNVGDIHVFLCR